MLVLLQLYFIGIYPQIDINVIINTIIINNIHNDS